MSGPPEGSALSSHTIFFAAKLNGCNAAYLDVVFIGMTKKEFLTFLLALLICPWPLFATEHPIDTTHSRISIHVGKSGLFSAAGHEHEVTAPISKGVIDDSAAGHIWFQVETAQMKVLPEKDREAVQSTMQKDVLESARFPEIRFESTSVQQIGEGRWKVKGNLTLHGTTASITVDVHNDSGAYLGETRIRQTQFGIQPVSVAGGTVKVKDEVKIDFAIVIK